MGVGGLLMLIGGGAALLGLAAGAALFFGALANARREVPRSGDRTLWALFLIGLGGGTATLLLVYFIIAPTIR